MKIDSIEFVNFYGVLIQGLHEWRIRGLGEMDSAASVIRGIETERHYVGCR